LSGATTWTGDSGLRATIGAVGSAGLEQAASGKA